MKYLMSLRRLSPSESEIGQKEQYGCPAEGGYSQQGGDQEWRAHWASSLDDC
jgi:hypothetical protein